MPKIASCPFPYFHSIRESNKKSDEVEKIKFVLQDNSSLAASNSADASSMGTVDFSSEIAKSLNFTA